MEKVESAKQHNGTRLKGLISEYYPILAVLAGFLLVVSSLGPFTNGDTTWELDATSGVLNSGLPYANGHYLIDQPPIGFYLQAVWASIFGLSIQEGTVFTTLIGLACLILVYVIGAALYGRVTGVLAAALMGFSPWHLILSRAYLIDVQCLLFSLLSLAVAVYAIRRSSFGLFLASGIIFAVALNTKLYAVFALIPILALFLFHQSKKPLRAIVWLAAFGLPALIASFLWYEIIAGINMSSIVLHTDFAIHNAVGVVPSYFFASNFVLNYGVGWIFAGLAVLSLATGAIIWSHNRSLLIIDVICLVTILAVIGVDTALGATLNLKPPYQNAIKYCYQALPFLALLAASLVPKSLMVMGHANDGNFRKWGIRVLFGIGLFLTVDALVFNMRYVNLLSGADFLIFRVVPTSDIGYSFFVSNPLTNSGALLFVQITGFVVGLSGLAWLAINGFRSRLKRGHFTN